MSLANKFGMSLYVIKRDKITQKVVLKMSKALSPQTLDDIHLKMRGAAVGDELVLRWKRIGAPAGDMPVQWKGIIAESYSTATATAIVRWSAGANQKGMTAGGLYAFPTPMLTNGTVEGELTILPALEVGAQQPTPKHKPPRVPQLHHNNHHHHRQTLRTSLSVHKPPARLRRKPASNDAPHNPHPTD